MGVAKEKMMSIAARGYGESNKYVCSGCVKDQYLQKVIRAKGQVGTCSFCKDENGKPIRHRKTYPLESLMSEIIPAIDYYYMSTDGNIPYDKETEEYLGSFIDPYSFVYDILADEMQVEEPELLKELFDILEPENRTTIFEFEDRTADKDLKAWAKFTSLVNGRKEMSVEQIVSLCDNKDAPDDLKEIHAVLRVVLAHAKKLYAYIYKENGGKHTALNEGIKNIESDLTFIVDSDDWLKPNAIETVLRYYGKFWDRNGLCGYSFLRVFPDGKINGNLMNGLLRT